MATSLKADFTVQLRSAFSVTCEEFQIVDGVTVLFGPSGAGKSTLLRALAGLQRPNSGEIRYGDEIWYSAKHKIFMPPEKRGIGFVTQEDSLFPHLTALENAAYGVRHSDDRVRFMRAAALLDRFGLSPMAGSYPARLSGGERQRVALARSLATDPRLIMLDEPFSALDLPTRETLQRELALTLHEMNLPAILVTHFPNEAIAMGRHVAVIANGRIIQRGNVSEVFSRPANADVARIVGTETFVAGRIIERKDNLVAIRVAGASDRSRLLHAIEPDFTEEAVYVSIHSQDVILELPSEHPSSARNRILGTVASIESDGLALRVVIDVGFPLTARITRQAATELSISVGGRILALLKAPAIHLIPARL